MSCSRIVKQRVERIFGTVVESVLLQMFGRCVILEYDYAKWKHHNTVSSKEDEKIL
jgi:hypothetical protein